jgi:hypothetical protein
MTLRSVADAGCHFIAMTLVFFVVAIGYVRFCDRMK